MGVQLANITRHIKLLYQDGEYPFADELNFLIKENLLIRLENKCIISE